MNIVLLEGLAVPQQTIEELAASLKEQGHTFTAWLDGKWDPETLNQRIQGGLILVSGDGPHQDGRGAHALPSFSSCRNSRMRLRASTRCSTE